MTDMARKVVVAATQFHCSPQPEENLNKAETLIRQAVVQGAQLVLIQEFFETLYFCQEQNPDYFAWARPLENNPVIQRFSNLAKELSVVLPFSFFERDNNAHYNTVAVIDADGSVLGTYRKSHIPDGPGYQEKFYFNPGDTGFKVFNTRYCRLGVGICWDQWFPECARCLAVQGAEVLVYPTAIGNEPQDPSVNSYPHWTRVMQGHAGANLMPLVVSNRVGAEHVGAATLTFFGGSFIAGIKGEIVSQVGASSGVPEGQMDPHPQQVEGVVLATFDLDEVQKIRAGWGVFRDRRPQLYTPLLTSDGHTQP